MTVFAWTMVVVFGLIALGCAAMVIGAANDKSGGDYGRAMGAMVAVVFLGIGLLSAIASATIAVLAMR